MNRRDFLKLLFSAPTAVALATREIMRVDEPSFLSIGAYSYESELVKMTHRSKWLEQRTRESLLFYEKLERQNHERLKLKFLAERQRPAHAIT